MSTNQPNNAQQRPQPAAAPLSFLSFISFLPSTLQSFCISTLSTTLISTLFLLRNYGQKTLPLLSPEPIKRIRLLEPSPPPCPVTQLPPSPPLTPPGKHFLVELSLPSPVVQRPPSPPLTPPAKRATKRKLSCIDLPSPSPAEQSLPTPPCTEERPVKRRRLDAGQPRPAVDPSELIDTTPPQPPSNPPWDELPDPTKARLTALYQDTIARAWGYLPRDCFTGYAHPLGLSTYRDGNGEVTDELMRKYPEIMPVLIDIHEKHRDNFYELCHHRKSPSDDHMKRSAHRFPLAIFYNELDIPIEAVLADCADLFRPVQDGTLPSRRLYFKRHRLPLSISMTSLIPPIPYNLRSGACCMKRGTSLIVY